MTDLTIYGGRIRKRNGSGSGCRLDWDARLERGQNKKMNEWRSDLLVWERLNASMMTSSLVLFVENEKNLESPAFRSKDISFLELDSLISRRATSRWLARTFRQETE
jgi:hypothetical protein